ncbi:MAG TPA: hypothetical protein VHW09_26985 [Bryobacteraceae bacterium]|jgi:hypothetical protein|nr:hypothetical protein [Bryobacteraceae bacterium]
MNQYVIEIPDWLPTPLNKLMGNWRQSAKLKKQDREMIWAYSRLAKVPYERIKRSVELIITLEPAQRAVDPDSYQKSVGDALVNSYALWNDSHLWVEWLPIKFERGARRNTRILLRDIA